MVIRTAIPADCKIIASILFAAFLPFKARYTEAAFAATVLNEKAVLARMKKGISWLATENGQPFGTCSIKYTNNGHYITGMAVLPAAQGKKTGRRLMETVEENARQSGVSRLHLMTTPFLQRAIALYVHCGFSIVENGITEWMGQEVIQFEKILNQ